MTALHARPRSSRVAHLAGGNLLRTLTEVIDAVPGGINLGQGVCDLDPPAPLVAGAVDAVRGVGGERQTYTPYRGLPGLREVLSRRLAEFHGLRVDADGLCITLGSSGALFATLLALFEPGDEVLLFEPFYSYHRSTLLLAGLTPVCVPLRPTDFGLDLAALRAARSSRTRGLIVNTPANPTGKVFSAKELESIGELLAGSDTLVLTDEVYDHMVFDGRRHVAPATVPNLEGRCLTLGSFSKTFSATGWRVGYVAGPADIVDSIGQVCDQVHVCAPRPMQRGVERALRDLPEAFYRELGKGYERRRDRFCEALQKAGFRFHLPEGAYYVLADYRAVLGDELDPHAAALAMIERVRINGVPGHVFHEQAADVRSIRFHFAVDDEVLDEACRRLETM